ncbi:hypothetical protein GCM10027521_14950 [Amycolatopsis cihanbeyliensis]
MTPGPNDPPDGPLPAEFFYREQQENRLSVLAATFAAHIDLVWALGGWTALTGAETIGLLLAAEAVSAGEFIAEPSMLYRKHGDQTTASERYWDDGESDARLTIALERAKALRGMGWKWQQPRPFDPAACEAEEQDRAQLPPEGRQAAAMARMTTQ